ncbi:MAG TPA: hypothetical protein VHG08_12025 [Longimicrobium sp.]|nr:hypothetical protein [Longimicrobium sp.]
MIIRPAHLAALAFVCACSGAPAAERSAAREDSAESPVQRDTVVRRVDVEPLPNLYDSVTIDVDGDGTAERVELGSNLPDDERYYDVHHRWSVIVRDGPDSYPLLHDYVPAVAAFWVIPADSTRPAEILVQISALHGPSEGTRLEKFVFDRSRGGYVRTGLVEGWGSEGHAYYRGPQGFEEVPPTGPNRHDPVGHRPPDSP